MNLTTLIKKKKVLFDNAKFTKALDTIFGGDFNNKATIDGFDRIVIQYKDKNEGCVLFQRDSSGVESSGYITAVICKTKRPNDGLSWWYQTQQIPGRATLAQFKKFLTSVFNIHYHIMEKVELEHKIGKEIVKLGRLETQLHKK